MVEKLNLSKEEIAKIEEIVKNPPPVTDYVRRYIEAYRKKCAGSSEAEQGALNSKVEVSKSSRHTKITLDKQDILLYKHSVARRNTIWLTVLR